MSENLENQAVNENVTDNSQETVNTTSNDVSNEVNTEIVPETQETNSIENKTDRTDNAENEKKSIEILSQIFQTIADKKRELDNEIKLKQDYLNTNLGDYNTENYLQNQDFRNLYSEAFEALGTKLDTKKFVNLLDKYVESRISIHNKNQAIKSENDNLTDSFDFKTGSAKQEPKLKRLQDIPDDELASYIAKYI